MSGAFKLGMDFPTLSRHDWCPLKKHRSIIAVVLLLVFAAGNSALLPAMLTAVTWLDRDHAVSLVASHGHWDLVLSHHNEEAHTAALLADSHHDHQHGWAAGMLVTLSEAPAHDGDHVIHFTLSAQASTEQMNATPAVPAATAAPCPPASPLATVRARPAIPPVAAARPPPVSQLLLTLRTTVLVV